MFPSQLYNGVGQITNNWGLSGGIPAWLYGDYGGSGGARIDASNCVAAYCPIGAASYAASKVNLANPGTYNASPGVDPTFAADTGWTFNGTQYLTTGVVPTLTYTAICRFSNVTNNGWLFGVINAASFISFAIVPNGTDIGNVVRYRLGVRVNDKAPVLTGGVLAIAGVNTYRNGISDGTIESSGSNPETDIWLAAISGGGAASKGALNMQAFWVYNITLSAQQVAGLTGAINALTSAGNYYL